MPFLDALYGYNALNAELEIANVADKTVTATATLPDYSDSTRAWAIPVVRERNELGGLKAAAEWIPTNDWHKLKKPFSVRSDQPGTGSQAEVTFDFGSVPTAEGAAVLFIVHAPTKGYDRYVELLSLAITTLHVAGEPEAARSLAVVADSIARNRCLVPRGKHNKTAKNGAMAVGSEANKGTDGTASLTEEEALQKALALSLVGSVIEKPLP